MSKQQLFGAPDTVVIHAAYTCGEGIVLYNKY